MGQIDIWQGMQKPVAMVQEEAALFAPTLQSVGDKPCGTEKGENKSGTKCHKKNSELLESSLEWDHEES